MCKLIAARREYETIGWYFFCPACEEDHLFYTKNYLPGGNPVWEFNGDVNNPTFSPSLNREGFSWKKKDVKCHLYLKNGKIQFLRDSSHEMAGETIDMVDFPEQE